MSHRKARRAMTLRALLPALTASTVLGVVSAHAAVPITGTQLQSNVGVTVLPDFQGGTLVLDQVITTDAHAYNVENFSTNTIDEFGHTITFTGGFSGAGPLTFTNSGVGGIAIFTGGNSISGAVTIDSGATVGWGNGGGGAFLIGPGNAVVDNGALIMDFGGAGVIGDVPISGTGSVEIKTGSFEELGPSTYTGGTTIDAAGTLTLGNSGTTEGMLAGNINDNGTLKFDYSAGPAVTTANPISGSGNVEFVSGTTVITSSSVVSGTVTIDSGATAQWGDGVVSGAFLVGALNAVTDNGALVMDMAGGIIGNVPISGTGSVEVKSGIFGESGTATYTGGTTIDSGATLQLGSGGVTGTVAGAIVDNGHLEFDYSGPVTFANLLSGSGNVEVFAGTTVATGTSIVGGTVTIDGGATLQWGSGGGAFLIGGGNAVTDNGALVMDFGGGGVAGDIPISGTGTVEVKTGTFTELGPATYTGTTTIDLGARLQLGSAGPGINGTLAGNIVDNGLLQFNYSGSATIGGTISGSGNAEIVTGTLVVTHFVSSVTGTVTIDPGATLQFGNGGAALFTGATGVVDNGALVLDFGGAGVGTTLPISGSGTFTMQSGSLNNDAVSTYTGSTTIDSGTILLLSGAGSIASSSVVNDNGVFDIGSTAAGTSIVDLAGSGKVNLGSKTLTITAASGTFSGVLADGSIFLPLATGGSLTIAAGTETLSGTNTFTGNTTINGGATLQLGNGGTTGTVASNIVDNGLVQFNYSGAVISNNAFSGTGAVEVVAGTVVETGFGGVSGNVTIDPGATLQWGNAGVGVLSGASIIDNGAFVIDFGGSALASGIPVSGTGGVEIKSGNVSFTAVNTYTGATAIDPGARFLLTGTGSISNSSLVTDNGTFDISGTAAGASITKLAGTGGVSLGGKTLTIANASGTFGGVFADGGAFGGTGGGLTIAGGTQTLTGTNTFTGATTINGGATLQLGAGGATGTVAGPIVDNGLVRFDYGGSVISNNAFSGTGAVEVVAGTVVETGFGGVSGNVTIDPGATLQWGNAGIGVLSGASIIDNGAFVIDFGGAALSSGVPVSGSGGVEIKSGNVSFAAVNTYTGTTAIDPGAQFLLIGTGSISNSSAITDNGTFDISGTTAGTSITKLAGTGGVSLGAKTLTITAASGTFSGVLADGGATPGTGGGLTIAGGTETLTGTNTFTGATTINGGATLQLGAGGATGTVAGPIVDNGSLKFNHSGSVTIPGAISGSGNAELVAGTLIVTSADIVGGTVAIDPGTTMQWGNGTGPAFFVGGGNAVVDNGALVMSFGGGSIAGSIPISGSGSVTLQSGAINDNGVSTYTGTTTINTGADFILSGTGSIANSALVTDNGTFDISTTTAGTSIKTLAGSGGVNLGSKTLTITNASGIFFGVISGTGGGLTIAGGSETLDGVNTYTGTTTVGTGATLIVGDAAHPGASIDSHTGGVIVNSGGLLEGHGTIVGAVSNTSGGTVAPGGTIGTLTVGSYTQGANSTLDIEVSPAAASQLNSLGAANLAGTLHLIFDPGLYTTHVYDILNGNPVSGTFSAVTSTGSPGVVFGVLYTSTQVDLLLVSTATAQPYGGVSTATVDRAHGIASLVEDRLRDLHCTGRPDEQSQSCEGTEVWAEGFGAWDGLDNQGPRAGFSNNAYGFVGGVDEHWSEGSTIGAAFAYESETLGVSAALSKASGSSYFGAVYGRWVAGQVFLDGEGFYMHTDWSMHRFVPGFGTALSSPSGDTKGLLLQASVPVDDGDLRPYLRGTYAEFDRSSTIETGVGAVGLAVASGSTDLGVAEGGLIWSHGYAMSDGELRPTLQLGFAESFGGRTPFVTAALVGAPGTVFTVASASPAPTAGVVGFSLGWDSSSDFQLTSDVRALVGTQNQVQVTLGGVYRF